MLWHDAYFDLYSPALACFVLMGPAGRAWGSADVLARTFLAFLSITEYMWLYPVAGSQTYCATLLCAVAGIVVLHDGAADLAAFTSRGNRSARISTGLAWSVLVAGTLMKCSLWASSGLEEYRHFTPLGLPGSRLIRLPPERVTAIRALAEEIRADCDSYLSFPGVNSYYFWSKKEPVTGFNTTNWMYFLTDRQRADIETGLARLSRPCIVIHRKALAMWMQGRPLDPTPATYVNEHFRYKTTIDNYEIWVKKDVNSAPDVDTEDDPAWETASEERVAFPEIVHSSQFHARAVPGACQ